MSNTSVLKLVQSRPALTDTLERIGIISENARCVLELVRHYLDDYREQFAGVSGITIEGCLHMVESGLKQIDDLTERAHEQA